MPVSDRMKRSQNCVGVCVDESAKGFKGRVYNCFSKTPQHFNDITELFYIIENVLDSLSFPAMKTRTRTFKRTDKEFYCAPIDAENRVYSVEELIPVHEKAGFIVMVTSRENATWQGFVYSKEDDVESTFNSEMELLKMLK